MLRVGLTGGIGSGKTTVAGLLAARGATIVDADALSRQVTAAGGMAISSIKASFGAEFIAPDGSMNRVLMRKLAYSDSGARRQLESIIHPLVANLTARRAEAARAEGSNCVVFDVPLLVESPSWRQKVDHVVVIDCPTDVQLRRVHERSQLEFAAIQAIITAQAPRALRLRAADSVVFNGDITLSSLSDALECLVQRFGLSSPPRIAPTEYPA